MNALFVGGLVREAVNDGRADYLPVFLSEVPSLFRKGVLPLDVALIHVSPPDRHGWCSLGVSIDVVIAAVQHATHVIAQINPRMPRTHGDGLLHVSRIHSAVLVDEPLPQVAQPKLGPIEKAIGRQVANLIEDGATLQMGIGAIPDAVLAALGDHRHLGVHTEMFSDGLVDLVERGAITGEFKRVHPGKIVAGFAMGTQKLYDFVDDNPLVAMLDIAYVNDVEVIRRNPRVSAINSAIEVDLTGQVCADSIGTRLFSGVGGQMDFIRGASLSEGGKPIIARRVPPGAHPQARRGRGDDARPRALDRDGIRRGQPVWAEFAAARARFDRHRASGSPRGAGRRGRQAVWHDLRSLPARHSTHWLWPSRSHASRAARAISST